MSHSNSTATGRGLSSSTNFDYDIMIEDAKRYYDTVILSDVIGFTITHKGLCKRANSSWDDVFFVRGRRLPVYPHHFDPMRIIFSPRQTWRVQRLSRQEVNVLSDNHYVFNFVTYLDMRNYIRVDIRDTATGLVAIPCKDLGDNLYFYFGIYKIDAAGSIKNQNSGSITIFPGGPGGDGDTAGRRIPAP